MDVRGRFDYFWCNRKDLLLPTCTRVAFATSDGPQGDVCASDKQLENYYMAVEAMLNGKPRKASAER